MKEQEEEAQKTSSQPPYYDMAATESTPNPDKLVRTSLVLKSIHLSIYSI